MLVVMCEDKEEARSEAAAAVTPKRLCWPKRPPAPLPDTRGLCCAKLLRKNGKAKKVRHFWIYVSAKYNNFYKQF